jgi:uncharacterized membrane protein (Fun14 family)
MNSFTFILALIVTAFGAWAWFKQAGDIPARFPWYGTVAGSYAGGFLIGRVFRRVLKVAALMAAILVVGLVLLNRAHVDTSKVSHAVESGSTWVQQRAIRTTDYLLHLLPSGAAAAVGAFAGRGQKRAC